MHWPTKYTVRGKWPFPTDMLRHDISRPFSTLDQKLIEAMSKDEAPDFGLRSVSIRLTGDFEPNVKRWKSFDWMVVSDELAA